MTRQYYAHSHPDYPGRPGKRQTFEKDLKNVGQEAVDL